MRALLPGGSPPAEAAGRLVYADGLRGLAALWVVLFHASEGGHLERLKATLPPVVVAALFDHGHLGVPVFFVLSGFVMALTVHAADVDAAFALRFVVRRMVRLTPPYALSIGLVVALLVVKGWALKSAVPLPSAGTVLAHLAYLQDMLGVAPINSVYWTLGIEVQFYLVFALLVFAADRAGGWASRRDARLWLFGLTSAIALLWPIGLVTTPLWPGGFIPFWFSFAAGVLVCWGWRTGGAAAHGALLFCIAVAVSAALGGSAVALTAASTAATLLVAGRLGKMQHWLRWRWVQFLGAISYSLYLLHNPLTGAGFNLVPARAARRGANRPGRPGSEHRDLRAGLLRGLPAGRNSEPALEPQHPAEARRAGGRRQAGVNADRPGPRRCSPSC